MQKPISLIYIFLQKQIHPHIQFLTNHRSCLYHVTDSIKASTITKMAAPQEADPVEVGAVFNQFDGLDESVVRSKRGRKRKVKPEERKRARAKQNRHSGIGKASSITCTHSTHGHGEKDSKSFCQASLLTENSLRVGWENFYASCSKRDQDTIISSLIDTGRPQRNRVRLCEQQKSRQLSVKYFLKNYDAYGSPFVQVCKAAFLSALGEFV